jgi:hypothetical protein
VAETFGVTPASIAAELPGLFPGGFTATTKPALDEVTSLITSAAAMAVLKLKAASDKVVIDDEAAGVVVERYVIERVKGQVVRMAYVGRDPAAVDAAARPYDDASVDAMATLIALVEKQTDDVLPRVRGIDGTCQRDLVINDDDLGGRGRWPRARRF